MKLPAGCEKLSPDILKGIITKARTEGIDGENSILVNGIEELKDLVKNNTELRVNKRVCSVVSDWESAKIYSENLKKGCEDKGISNYEQYLPEEDRDLAFRTEKEIRGNEFIKSIDDGQLIKEKELLENIGSVNKKMERYNEITPEQSND
jgi:hypothetical protein